MFFFVTGPQGTAAVGYVSFALVTFAPTLIVTFAPTHLTLLLPPKSTFAPTNVYHCPVRLNLRRYRGIQKILKSYRSTRICKFSRQKCRIYKFSRQKSAFELHDKTQCLALILSVQDIN